MIQLSPLILSGVSKTGGKPVGEPVDGELFAALMPGKPEPGGKTLPVGLAGLSPLLPDTTLDGDLTTVADGALGDGSPKKKSGSTPRDGDGESHGRGGSDGAQTLTATIITQTLEPLRAHSLISETVRPESTPAGAPRLSIDSAASPALMSTAQAAPTTVRAAPEGAGTVAPASLFAVSLDTVSTTVAPKLPSNDPLTARFGATEATVDSAPSAPPAIQAHRPSDPAPAGRIETPLPPLAVGAPLHAHDSGKIAAAFANVQSVLANRLNPAIESKTARSRVDALLPELRQPGLTPSQPAAVPMSATPIPPVGISPQADGSTFDRPAGTDHQQSVGEAMGQLIEHVEFGRTETGDTITHLRVLHEAVGRLGITIDGASDGAHVRLGSDDGAVRQTLVDAAPNLVRLAEERRVEIGSVGVGTLASGGREAGRDAPPRRDTDQPQHASPTAQLQAGRTTRSTGLFA